MEKVTQEYLKSMYKSNDKCMYHRFIDMQDSLNKYAKNDLLKNTADKFNRIFEFNNFDLNGKNRIEEFIFDELYSKARNKIEKQIEIIQEEINEKLEDFYRTIGNILSSPSLTTDEMQRKISNEYYRVNDFFDDVMYYDITHDMDLFDRDFNNRFFRIYDVDDKLQWDFKEVMKKSTSDMTENMNNIKNESVDHVKYNFKQNYESLEKDISNIRTKPIEEQKVEEKINNDPTNSTEDLISDIDNMIYTLSEEDKIMEHQNMNDINNQSIPISNDNDKLNDKLTQQQIYQIINELNPELLKARLQFENGTNISFKQYLEEFFAPFMPTETSVKLSNGVTIPRKQYLEEIVFSNATKYNRNVESLINETTGKENDVINNNELFISELKNMMNTRMKINADKGLSDINITIDDFVNDFKNSFSRLANGNPEQEQILNELFEELRNNLKKKFENMINNLKKSNVGINNSMIDMASHEFCNFEQSLTDEMLNEYALASDLSGYSIDMGTDFTTLGGKVATRLNIPNNLRSKLFSMINQAEVLFDQKITPIFNQINNSNIKEAANVFASANLSNDFIKNNDRQMTQDEIRNILIECYKNNNIVIEETEEKGMRR